MLVSMTLPGVERKEKKVDKYARHFTCFQFGENVRSGALLAQSGLITTGKKYYATLHAPYRFNRMNKKPLLFSGFSFTILKSDCGNGAV